MLASVTTLAVCFKSASAGLREIRYVGVFLRRPEPMQRFKRHVILPMDPAQKVGVE